MPESLLKRLHKIFPWVEFVQTYGLSEVGILRSKSKNSDSIWVKVGGEGFKIKVIDGVLWIKADSAMLGYLNAPNPFDEEGWMNTGDLVEVGGDYIRILGRKSDVINVGGQKVYPAEVESVLLEMNNVVNASVRGEKNLMTGNVVAARLTLAEPEELSALKKRVRKFCRERLESYKVPIKIEITEDVQCSDRFKKVKT
jgi:acyl-CoA synthetase (AMP-forming)/AMP-acid ligase II